MATLITIYSEDVDLLHAIGQSFDPKQAQVGSPAEVDAPRTLNLDLATIAGSVWELLVAFGGIKASIESISLIAKLVRDRTSQSRVAKVEISGPNGIKVTLDGAMTPAQMAAEIEKYRLILHKAE